MIKATGFGVSDLIKKGKKDILFEPFKKRSEKRDRRRLAIKTALEMQKSEFDIETIARVTDLSPRWLKRFFKRLKLAVSEF